MNSLTDRSFGDFLKENGLLVDGGSSHITNEQIHQVVDLFPIRELSDSTRKKSSKKERSHLSKNSLVLNKDGILIRAVACGCNMVEKEKKLVLSPCDISLQELGNVVTEIQNGGKLKINRLRAINGCLVYSRSLFSFDKPDYSAFPNLKGCFGTTCVENTDVYDAETSKRIGDYFEEISQNSKYPSRYPRADRFEAHVAEKFLPVSTGRVSTLNIRNLNFANLCTVITLYDAQNNSVTETYRPDEVDDSQICLTARISDRCVMRMVKKL